MIKRKIKSVVTRKINAVLNPFSSYNFTTAKCKKINKGNIERILNHIVNLSLDLFVAFIFFTENKYAPVEANTGGLFLS